MAIISAMQRIWRSSGMLSNFCPTKRPKWTAAEGFSTFDWNASQALAKVPQCGFSTEVLRRLTPEFLLLTAESKF
jgi:hypothetical protein